jgi:hypothetical protein
MLLGVDFRRQARVCARLAEECDDRHLAQTSSSTLQIPHPHDVIVTHFS